MPNYEEYQGPNSKERQDLLSKLSPTTTITKEMLNPLRNKNDKDFEQERQNLNMQVSTQFKKLTNYLKELSGDTGRPTPEAYIRLTKAQNQELRKILNEAESDYWASVNEPRWKEYHDAYLSSSALLSWSNNIPTKGNIRDTALADLLKCSHVTQTLYERILKFHDEHPEIGPLAWRVKEQKPPKGAEYRGYQDEGSKPINPFLPRG